MSQEMAINAAIAHHDAEAIRDAAVAAGVLAAAQAAVAKTGVAAGAGAVAAGNGFRLLGTGMRLTGTTLHWIIAGTAELAAVLIPATVAAGAWAAVWLQGATNVYTHIMAVYGATEATGQAAGHTAGDVLGLSHSLQAAQNAANPQVYKALGAAILIVNEAGGNLAKTGLQMGQVFDNFMDRVAVDFSATGGAAKELNGILGHMVTDLTEIGQVFGNLGAAIASAASQMPGLAEVLLRILDNFTGLIKTVVEFASYMRIGSMSVLTMVMALEEFNRWGSLVSTVLGKMGLATTELSGTTGSYFLMGDRFIGVIKNMIGILPQAAFAVASLASKIPILGAAIVGQTADVDAARAATMEWIEGLSTLETLGIAAAVVGLAFLIDKLVTAKSAAQDFADSITKAVGASANVAVLNTITTGIGKLNVALAQNGAAMRDNIGTGDQVADTMRNVGKFADSSAMAVGYQAYQYHQGQEAAQTYTATQIALNQEFVTAAKHGEDLAKTYRTTLTGAMALADQAGVKLAYTVQSQNWAAAQIKIASYVLGLHAMGQTAGMVGKDVDALQISSELAGTGISKLTQAWDQLIQGVTGGTSAMGALVESLSNIGQVTQSSAGKLGEYGGSMTLTMSQVAQSLKGFGAIGSQTWQNFDTSLSGSAEQLANWFQTATTEGAIKGGQLTKSILDIASGFVGFARDSKPAQSELLLFAQQAGLNIRTFPQLEAALKTSGASMNDLGKQVGNTTNAMSSMSAIMQQLAGVMQTDVIDQMGTAALKTDGVAQATQTYSKYIQNNTQNTAAGRGARANLISDLVRAGVSAKQAAQLVQQLINSLHQIPSHVATTYTFTEQEIFKTTGTNPGNIPYLPGSGGGRKIVLSGAAAGGNVTIVHQNIAGSVLSDQALARAAQGATLRKTVRNASTQTFLPGRLH